MADSGPLPTDRPDSTTNQVRGRDRVAIKLVAESILISVAAIVIYAVIPLSGRATTGVIIWLSLALLTVGAVFAWQLRAIAVSAMPMRRAMYAMFMLVPMFVLVFAANYTMVSANDPTAFTEPLSRLDALYFTVTTLTTVGYGDISPRSDLARIITMVQMVVNVVVLGVAVRLIFDTARRAGSEHPGD